MLKERAAVHRWMSDMVRKMEALYCARLLDELPSWPGYNKGERPSFDVKWWTREVLEYLEGIQDLWDANVTGPVEVEPEDALVDHPSLALLVKFPYSVWVGSQ